MAYRYIAAYAEGLGLASGFTIVDPAEAGDLMDLMRPDHGLVGTTVRLPRSATLVEIYSRCINTSRKVHEVVPGEYPWCEPHVDAIAGLFRAFTARKRQSALLDFDDLLLYWRALLGDAQLGRRLSDSFDFVLIDEYQDVNRLQADIAQGLAPDGRGLTVVGDEAQAIYGFRGADSRYLRELVLGYSNASVIQLPRNFRSRQPILDVANVLRPDDGPPLRLYSERGSGVKPRLLRCHDAPSEARTIAESILEALERGVMLREQAVLVRAGHHSDLIELELSARKVPYRKYGGLRFLETAHVKDYISAARLLDNPRDELAWYRLLRLHDGIGPSRARGLIQTIHSLDDGLRQWPEVVAAAPATTRVTLSDSLGTLANARSLPSTARRAESTLDAIRPLILGRYADAAARLGDLERLASAAAVVEDVSAWLAQLTLDPPSSSGDLAGPPHLDEDYVVVSTIHSAKGLEWSIVHIPHVIDGMIPIDMSLSSPDGLNEERRLFYVAVTRARDELHLYAPLRMPHHRRASDDRHSFVPMSRFIDERATSALEVSEEAPHVSSVVAGPSSPVTVDLDPLWS
jgi:DNA helicase-2/ATP-dependent DNA helicase PcrA